MFQGLVVLITSIVFAWLVTGKLISVLRRRGVLDIPNSRSSHTIPTPRGGGIGIIGGLLAGALAAAVLGMQGARPELFLAAALIALIGFMDDRYRLSVFIRLALQLMAAGMVLMRAGGLVRLPLPEPLDVSLGFLAVPVALLWIVGLTNIFNFLDGIDGFAGLQGVIAGLGIALLGQGDVFTAMGFAIAGACLGFLVHNWHPAKVFMGDVGSGTLGFLLAAVPFELSHVYRSSAVFVLAMCLWFFLSDGVFTIFRRLFRGEKIWLAHRSHLYQRLHATGMQHNQVAGRVLSAAGVLALFTVVSVRWGTPFTQWLVLSLALAGFLAYYRWTSLKERFLSASKLTATCSPSLQQNAEINVH